MATILKADGTRTEVKLAPSDERLDQLQAAVGGYIEIVGRDAEGSVIYANEEGLNHNLPLNQAISAIAGRPIVGDCIILTPQEAAEDEGP